MKPRFRSMKPHLALSCWLVAVAAGLGLAMAVARQAAEEHLRADAEHTATQYAQFLVAAVPDIDMLMRDRRVSRQTREQLERMRQTGDVFRFKMFDRKGNMILVSDDLDQADFGAGGTLGEHHGKRSAQVQGVVLGGDSFIELKDGTRKADRPALYSEAYVPLMRDAQVLGVVEVYVDQTSRRARIENSFATVAGVVAIVLLALGILGAWQWIVRLRAQHRVEDRMRYLARHDVLSGALNRASFQEALAQATWQHETSATGYAVLCVDLDRFKDVNDSMGHAAGDEVLRQVTVRLRALVRHGDQLARLGGDEFAVLQSGVTGAEDVTRLAQRIVDSLAQPFEVDERHVVCGASVGAAIFEVDADSNEELMHKADLALYRAKASGRGSFSFYDAELDNQLRARRELTQELRSAIAEEKLTLDYQPLYAADGTTLKGYEALLRWRHPERGNVPPSEFIPLAEASELIITLGAWVLRRACMDAASWPEPLTVAVNLSAAQFRDDELVGSVEQALAMSNLPPRRLELEITESLLMTNTESVVNTLGVLSRMGIRIAMDDFGTGYSSLAYLWRFPFDKVKIDRAFTEGLSEDPKVDVIVRSIISLAHSLDIEVNAEGVETAGQLGSLQRHGCDELQGFLLGRPAPLSTLRHGPHGTEAHGSAAAGTCAPLPVEAGA